MSIEIATSRLSYALPILADDVADTVGEASPTAQVLAHVGRLMCDEARVLGMRIAVLADPTVRSIITAQENITTILVYPPYGCDTDVVVALKRTVDDPDEVRERATIVSEYGYVLDDEHTIETVHVGSLTVRITVADLGRVPLSSDEFELLRACGKLETVTESRDVVVCR
jgi:hypothetical protein